MLRQAYFQSNVAEFTSASDDAVLGQLAAAHGFALDLAQRNAWLVQLHYLRGEIATLPDATVFLEFAIPRMGKRADTVLLVGGIVFVIEFKVGSETFDRSALEQVHDYALDLKNFHLGSHGLVIAPILVATDAASAQEPNIHLASDDVIEPIKVGRFGLADAIRSVLDATPNLNLDPEAWLSSGYRPTPTIIEAAQALYRDHDVQEISRSDAGAKNLAATTDFINDVVRQAQTERLHAICFVTGVPGAGKTLAGLNIATQRADEADDEHAVFLSGNGPLVSILREALARDQSARESLRIGDARRRVASFIQNIHHFRHEAIRDPNPPHERIVIFDEAQRAWTKDQASRFMKEKRGLADFEMSEPEFLISVMDRHADWCVIICLVGGGQEINTGEAGLSEWVTALQHSFPDWRIFVSDRLQDPDYIWTQAAENALERPEVETSAALHLGVSMRSFRAETVSDFVGHLLENRIVQAREVFGSFRARYPIHVTRDLNRAREWLRAQARGTERVGLVASSGGYRLRSEGINPRVKIDPPNWFLNPREDVRSSFALEEVATEFDIQGLELDWTAVCWDLDLRYVDGAWRSFRFVGSRWQQVRSDEKRLYLKNAYRVLLTRARQGMVLFVPRGSAADETRPPEAYDAVVSALIDCGATSLD